MQDKSELPSGLIKPTVTVYAVMNEPREYDVVGVGQLEIVSDEDVRYYIEVKEKDTGHLLLNSRLDKTNNYQKQQGSIIIWTDPEQSKYEDLGIAFNKEENEVCDYYWRIICEKIGKNYLHINSSRPLQKPTQQNLSDILEHSKANIEIINYNIVNSTDYIDQFVRLFYLLAADCNQPETTNSKGLEINGSSKQTETSLELIVKIVRMLLINLDLRGIQILMSQHYFHFIIDVYKYYFHLDISKGYQQLAIMELSSLSKELIQKIQIYHNVAYFKQNILVYDGYNECIENSLSMISRQIQAEIISHFSKDDILSSILLPQQNESMIMQDNLQISPLPQNNLILGHLKVLRGVFVTFKICHNERLRNKFVDKIYESRVLPSLLDYIRLDYLWPYEFLIYLAEANPCRFVNYLSDQAREHPGNNLNLELAKRFSKGSSSMQEAILQLLHMEIKQPTSSKDHIQFLNGTFLCYCYSCCSDAGALIKCMHLLLENRNCIVKVLDQIVKSRVLARVFMELSERRASKQVDLLVIQILSIVLEELKRMETMNLAIGAELHRKVIPHIVECGLFTYCLNILQQNFRKYNILSSSMLKNLKMLESMHYNAMTEYIQQNSTSIEISDDMIKTSVQQILKIKKNYTMESEGLAMKQRHEKNLENQEQQNYLCNELEETNGQHKGIEEEKPTSKEDDLNSLKRLRNELIDTYQEESMQARKQVKPNEPLISIQFELDFPQEMKD